MKIASGVIAVLMCVSTTAVGAASLPGPLVDTAWLATHLNDKNLAILDVRPDIDSFSKKVSTAPAIPGMNPCGAKQGDKKDVKKPAINGHIANARLWDWKTVRTKRTVDGIELDGMAPTRSDFERLMRDLGINNNSAVVLVANADDTPSLTFATRAYWTLKYFGHDQVAILNGGTAKWAAEKRPLVFDASAPAKGNFSVKAERRELLATTADVDAAVRDRRVQVIDGRTPEFFAGQTKKDYVYAKGHIPGAKNMPHPQLVDAQAHTFKSLDALRQLAAQIDVDPAKPIITYCDSGHLSSGQWFVFHELLGNKDVKLYDGSMHEWTKRERPVEAATQ